MPLSRQAVSQQVLARLTTTVQGKYRVERLLGVGGTAAVYAATHRNGHRVAIKFQLDHLRDDPDIARLFSREAYVANRVGHPGAVPVLDDDVDVDGCAFLIMPLLEGETVHARWNRAGRRLAMAEVCTLALDLLDVLASAHAKGIVHRDIKPDNLFITSAGTLRVLDFGIARRIDVEGTVTVGMVGTPAFMPPEQALGDRRSIGPRSDVWAVGATMFALLSGEFVHKVDGPLGMVSAAATRPARLLADVSDAPCEIARVVDKALAFDPAERWRTAREMQEALGTALQVALGKSPESIARRVREELAEELFQTVHDRHAEETRKPRRIRQDASDVPLQRRDSKGVELGGIEQATKRRARSLRGSLFFAGLAALAMSSVVVGFWRGRSRATNQVDAAVQVLPQDEVTSSNPEALVHFNMGIQRWRDASREDAAQSFERAIEIDPTLATAHLYLSMFVFWPDDSARRHHHNASVHRNRLGARDRALLDAFVPAMATPSDLLGTANRLEAVRDTFPQDWIVLTSLASSWMRIGRARDALELFDDLLRRDGQLAIAWSVRAVASALLDDIAGTRESLAACLRISPFATRCLRHLAELDSNEGLCDAAEQSFRTLMAAPSPSHECARGLAQSIHRRGAPMKSVRDVLDRAWQLAPEKTRNVVRHWNDAHVQVLTGAFDDALATTDAWSSATAHDRYEDAHARIAKIRMYTALELGARERAARMASDFLSKRDAWLAETYYDWEILALRVQYLAGALSRKRYQERREAWLARESERPQLMAALNQRWVFAYALAATTPDDAGDAFRVLSQYLPFTDAFNRDTELDYGIGLAHLTAGQVPTAIGYLERAARSCKVIDFPFEHTWAHAQLGAALEQKGDTSGACAAYGVVLQRWGKETRSQSATLARARVTALRCPAP